MFSPTASKNFIPISCFTSSFATPCPLGFRSIEEPFDSLITLEDLGLENPQQWIFKHTLVELSTAVKGFALQKLLALPGCTEVLYFDPDIVVLSSLRRLLAEFANASILLTPHLAEPEITTDAILDNEFSVLRHGIYNLGFIGIKNSPEGRRFAAWWTDRLHHFCYDDIPRGIFTDQRWADLVPAYFADHKILRDPGYNVCTWNLTNRTVTGSLADGLLVNGEPIVFYHFSGFDSGAQRGMLDKYGQSMPAFTSCANGISPSASAWDRVSSPPSPGHTDFSTTASRVLHNPSQAATASAPICKPGFRIPIPLRM